ncbi:MAG TPA: hypothetical protein VKZ60_12975 [Chloroflexota bacterium]|nr:hypothetical protein [Chloroflexota bacterium]
MQSTPRLAPPFASLVLVFVTSLALGTLALLTGWWLEARVWGDEPAPPPLVPAVEAWVGRLAGEPAPPPLPTPTPTPEPPPPPAPILATHRLVTFYGNPLTETMGILGQRPPERMIERLRQQAAAYQQAGGRPVLAALHLVTPVAQAQPGADGMYRLRMDPELLEEWCDLAERHGLSFILDVQVGRSSVQEEVEQLRPWLVRPHVHLALDPEFAMSPSTEPGKQIGSLSAADINWAIEYLADIAITHRTGNRILIVHQFTDHMVPDRENLEPNPYVDLVLMMDGFGAPALKRAQYDRYIATAPVDFTGIKLFYQHDRPLMTPAEVLTLDPPPDVITYQ